ncbi:hypothetical protein BSLG_008694 [Batrachochytrium salamandrivorans]|nr:hypothetical protein BASA83_004394 [Batrachochytrium salamandrivorans]KAJ1332390.1 hypothetical protein BSLG_008694 [Batrachochytrium salamandrivorans]
MDPLLDFDNSGGATSSTVVDAQEKQRLIQSAKKEKRKEQRRATQQQQQQQQQLQPLPMHSQLHQQMHINGPQTHPFPNHSMMHSYVHSQMNRPFSQIPQFPQFPQIPPFPQFPQISPFPQIPQFPPFPQFPQIPPFPPFPNMHAPPPVSLHHAPDGKPYYYNPATGKSTWVTPPTKSSSKVPDPTTPTVESSVVITELVDEPEVTKDPSGEEDPLPVDNSIPEVQLNDESGDDDEGNPDISMEKKDDAKSDSNSDSDLESESVSTSDSDSDSDLGSDKDMDNSLDAVVPERAIAMKRIPETTWSIVLTSLNHEFYFNQDTQSVSWDMPEEIVNIVGELLASAMDVDLEEFSEYDEDVDDDHLQSNDIPVGQYPADAHFDGGHASTDPLLKGTVDSTLVNTGGNGLEKHVSNTIESELEGVQPPPLASVALAPVLSHTEVVEQFNQMLKDINPSPFSTWESEEVKMNQDPRFQLVTTSKERRRLFDKYCQSQAQATATVVLSASKDARLAYIDLLKAELTLRTRFSDFSRKFKRDPRFTNLASILDREALFSAHMDTLKGETAKRRQEDAAKIKTDFISMLKQNRWITHKSIWADVRRDLGSDSRFIAVVSPIDRETWFRTYISSMSASGASNTDGGDNPSALQEKSIRERTEQVRIERFAQQRKSKAQLSHLQHDGAVTMFQTLLIDHVKAHTIKYSDVDEKMQRDPRYPHLLDLAARQSVFKKHIDTLFKKRVDAFHSLLDTVTKLTSTYSELASFLATDARTIQLELESEASLEELFKSYMETKRKDAEATLDLSFSKNAFIDFHVRAAMQSAIVDAVERGLAVPVEGDEWRWISLYEIKQVMQSERAWLVFDAFPLERDRMLMRYVKQVVVRVREERGGTRDQVVATFAGAH